jgi:heat shock protein HslJ
MKRKFLFAMTFTATITLFYCKPPDKTQTVTVGDNSRNSLDWAGTYTGVLPCADCEGIQTVIQLGNDSRYTMRTKYNGKTDEIRSASGSFTWNKEGSVITLSDMGSAPASYKVGENTLTQLDKSGNVVIGALAGNYILQKSDAGSITEKYWKLTELNGQSVTANGGKEAYVIFKKDANKVIGNGSCNNFTGTYELRSPNGIALSQMASTQMACMNMEVESRFLKVLEMVDNYYLKEDTLILNRAKMAPLARFTAVYLR